MVSYLPIAGRLRKCLEIGAKNLNKTASHVKIMYQRKLVKNLIHFVDNTYTCMIRPTSISLKTESMHSIYKDNQRRTSMNICSMHH